MEESSDIFSLENIRNNWLKFFEDLFRHVLQETEGIESTTGYDLTPVVKKFERFACKSGLVPSSEYDENDYEYGLSLALAASLEILTPSRSPSISGSASVSSEHEMASESELGSASVSGSASVICSASESTSMLENVSKSASTSEYASGSSASESLTGSASESLIGSASESLTGFASESLTGSASECASGVASECAPGFASESTTGFESTSEYKSGSVTSSVYAAGEGLAFNFSDLFHSYDRNLGSSIHRLLVEVAGADIDKFYQSIREKIRIKENLKIFLKRLTDKFLNGSPPLEMYFLAIISRIFSLMYKTGDTNPKTFIEAVTDTIFEGEMELQLVSSIKTHELVLQILRDAKDWIREFRDLKCGDASEYFSS